MGRRKERRVPAGFAAVTVAGRPRARNACTLREEDSEGEGNRVGADRGSDRGRSATRAGWDGDVEKEGTVLGKGAG
jgi:hypothetical protein